VDTDEARPAMRSEDGKHSRRGLFAGALALLGVETLTKAPRAQAGTDGDVVLGADNGPVTTRTAIRTANWKEFAVLADPNNDGNPYGSIGVWGHGQTYGVVGEADPSIVSSGVLGIGSLGGPAVVAQGGLGHGVSATSENGIGLYGVGTGATAWGVKGEARGTGVGVEGVNTSTGPGVSASNTGGGLALQVYGPSVLNGPSTLDGPSTFNAPYSSTFNGPSIFNSTAVFSRSGTVVIPSGVKTATVTPPGGLSSSALVLAVMQNVAGGVMVKAAVPNPGAGTFQIVLNKAPLSPASATVAWFVVN